MSLMPRFDVIAHLLPGAADRLRALRQRFHDTNTLFVVSRRLTATLQCDGPITL
jgi:hypothetical protein